MKLPADALYWLGADHRDAWRIVRLRRLDRQPGQAVQRQVAPRRRLQEGGIDRSHDDRLDRGDRPALAVEGTHAVAFRAGEEAKAQPRRAARVKAHTPPSEGHSYLSARGGILS